MKLLEHGSIQLWQVHGIYIVLNMGVIEKFSVRWQAEEYYESLVAMRGSK